jgi:hypothetical protein
MLFEDCNPLQVKGEDEIRARRHVGAEMSLKVESPERRLPDPQKYIFIIFWSVRSHLCGTEGPTPSTAHPLDDK